MFIYYMFFQGYAPFIDVENSLKTSVALWLNFPENCNKVQTLG